MRTGDSYAAPAYTHVQLSLPDEWVFYDARDLSEQGVAGGYVRTNEFVDPIDVPTTWDQAGTYTPQPVVGSYRQSYVFGFSPDGTPIGNLSRPSQFPAAAGFWAGGDFNALPDVGNGGTAFDSNGDIICGVNYVPVGGGVFRSRAAIWDSGGVRMISGLGEVRSSDCLGINSAGIYVGQAAPPTGPIIGRAFIGMNGTAAYLAYTGYNTERSQAVDINDDNLIAGTYRDAGNFNQGFRAKAFEDEFYPLESLPGATSTITRGMNNSGDIVGTASSASFERAILWRGTSTEAIDLNTLVNIPGETLVEAMDINNAGQILARGFNGYYIFTPIPEPAAALFVLVVGFATARRRAAR